MQDIRNQLLNSDEFVLSEVKKLQVLFELKTEIRYGETRSEVIDTESVAEHIYGMMILNEYFLPLEDNGTSFNLNRISRMILLHDIDEIETGDMIGYLKTDARRELERDAQEKVVARIPESLRENTNALLAEYEEQKTVESQYVRALDKIEPLFHLYNENGKKILLKNSTTRADSHSIKDKYVEKFSYVKRFNDVINEIMDKNGFFTIVVIKL